MRNAAKLLDLEALRADTRLYLAVTGGVLAALTAAAAAEDILTLRHVIATLLGYAVLAALVFRGIAAHRPQQRFGAANALFMRAFIESVANECERLLIVRWNPGHSVSAASFSDASRRRLQA